MRCLLACSKCSVAMEAISANYNSNPSATARKATNDSASYFAKDFLPLEDSPTTNSQSQQNRKHRTKPETEAHSGSWRQSARPKKTYSEPSLPRFQDKEKILGSKSSTTCSQGRVGDAGSRNSAAGVNSGSSEDELISPSDDRNRNFRSHESTTPTQLSSVNFYGKKPSFRKSVSADASIENRKKHVTCSVQDGRISGLSQDFVSPGRLHDDSKFNMTRVMGGSEYVKRGIRKSTSRKIQDGETSGWKSPPPFGVASQKHSLSRRNTETHEARTNLSESFEFDLPSPTTPSTSLGLSLLRFRCGRPGGVVKSRAALWCPVAVVLVMVVGVFHPPPSLISALAYSCVAVLTVGIFVNSSLCS